MGYENIDEATRREACERVKKIAETIKKIRKKYYLCFNKISDVDKQRYDNLKSQMQVIANENGLNKLSAELISNIDIQFDENIPDELGENREPSNNSIEETYQKYLTAVQLQAEVTVLFKSEHDPKLENAYLKKAQKIQEYIKKLSSILENSYSKFKLNSEKRNVLSEKFNEQTKAYFYKLFENSYRSTNDPLMKSEMLDILSEKTSSREEQPLERV